MNIGPIIFPLFAAAHFLIGVAALSAFAYAPVAAVCLALVEWVTCYDNTIVALGNRIASNRSRDVRISPIFDRSGPTWPPRSPIR